PMRVGSEVRNICRLSAAAARALLRRRTGSRLEPHSAAAFGLRRGLRPRGSCQAARTRKGDLQRCLWENIVIIEKELANIRDDNKRKALQAALSQIEKQFGKGWIMRLGEHEVSRDIQVVSTGSLGLDIALGVGGLPRGRIVEIYGPEASGKTTLTLSVIAQMPSHGGSPAF